MIQVDKSIFKKKKRQVVSKVELYNGSTLLDTFKQTDIIKSISIERVGESSKFFGFGVSTKIKVELINNGNLDISTINDFKAYIGLLDNDSTIYMAYPKTSITEVHKDEIKGTLSITSYDVLEKLKQHYFSEISLTNYTIKELVESIAELIGFEVVVPNIDLFNLSYEEGANFEGTETLKDIFDDVAEATGTIYFVNYEDKVVFKRLDRDSEAVETIDKSLYIELETSTNRRLQTIASVTDLGDNISASTSMIGTTQYIRDNGFLTLREDLSTIIDNLVDNLGDMSINQFNCNWRGLTYLEIGDKIGLEDKEGNIKYTYILNDTLTYDGALNEKTEWAFEDSEETETNPSNLGEVLKQTYAKVDKANKQVEIMASEVSGFSSDISSLKLNTESITASIKQIEENSNDSFNAMNETLDLITKEIETKMTSEDVSLQISQTLENGVSKVTTSTGFTFNEEGLTITKSDSEMKTNIDEDGMTITKDNEEVLTANNEGVTAIDLQAKTYLIIGNNSRFEDYNEDGEERTACFWIGGD